VGCVGAFSGVAARAAPTRGDESRAREKHRGIRDLGDRSVRVDRWGVVGGWESKTVRREKKWRV